MSSNYDDYDYQARPRKTAAPRRQEDGAPVRKRPARPDGMENRPMRRAPEGGARRKAVSQGDRADTERAARPRPRSSAAAERKAPPKSANRRPVSKGRKKARRRRPSFLITLLIWIVAVAAAFGVSFALRTYVFDVVRMSTDAMYSTAQNGDVVLVTRGDFEPERGDLVALRVDDGVLVRRVIGLPGETVSVDNNVTNIDGDPIIESYVSLANYQTFDTMTLAGNRYYVMGDNRSEVNDSRLADIGLIYRDQIEGKAKMIIWPLNHFKVF